MSDAQTHRPFSESSPLVPWLAAVVVIAYAVVSVLPLVWIGATAFKSQSDAIAYPPKLLFTPTLEGFVDLFTVQTHQPHDFFTKLPPPSTWYEKLARDRDMVIAGPSRVVERFVNSLVIGFGSTILATFLGTLAAYGFSRFRLTGEDDLLKSVHSRSAQHSIPAADALTRIISTLETEADWSRPLGVSVDTQLRHAIALRKSDFYIELQ